MKCPFCGGHAYAPDSSYSWGNYSWPLGDGKTIKLQVFNCCDCKTKFVTNPITGVFVAIG